ncbi:MAG: DUF953 domain-containing protein [Spirochaetes bacterium]|nr:DUF953 domain-containing protein [Spirochaetota bacterium]
MKKIILSTLIISVLGVTFCSKTEAPAEAKGKIRWYSFNEGIKAAADQKKPVIVDFYADWCTWCVKMEEEVFMEPKVLEKLKSDFIMIRIDTEAEEKIKYKGKTYTTHEFSTAFQVTGLPTLLFIDKAGEPVTKIPGYITADVFIQLITYMADECYSKKINFQDYQKGLAKCND